MNYRKLSLNRMGVMNITPNSFSDGGELTTKVDLLKRLVSFGDVEALDVGAESTAPMNDPISAAQEWERLSPILPLLKSLPLAVSIDSYHPETILKIGEQWLADGIRAPLIWNDVSGKFDDSVKDYLKLSKNFHYVYCHNLASSRELTGSHMNFVSSHSGDSFLDELVAHFLPGKHPQVILDPTLGFSKTYEQNWLILERLHEIQKRVGHHRWLIGLSRKSFLRKKHGIESVTSGNRDHLDQLHLQELKNLLPELKGEVWIRTHRPELLSSL
jgi:dihydropteroate synthase